MKIWRATRGVVLVSLVVLPTVLRYVVDGYCQTWIGQYDPFCWLFS